MSTFQGSTLKTSVGSTANTDSFSLVPNVPTGTEPAVGESPSADEVLPVVLLFPDLLFAPTLLFLGPRP